MASELVTLQATERAGNLNSVQKRRLDELLASGSQGHPQGIHQDVGAPMWFDEQGNPTSEPPEVMMARLSKELSTQMDEMSKRVTDYDENNPFNFDEMLAQASAQERYNPYYNAELSDFLKGIDTERQSAEGDKNLLVELNRIAAGAEKRNIDEAIRASEEGFAGVGLFESGARERATGLEKIQGQEQTGEREARFKYGMEEGARQLGSIGTQEQTGKRRLLAEKTATIQSDVENQKAEERARWEYERAQYLGNPYVTSQTSGLNDLLTKAFQY